ncbi:MAG: PmoA family protein [Candidatus Zipacnadales bacterium]
MPTPKTIETFKSVRVIEHNRNLSLPAQFTVLDEEQTAVAWIVKDMRLGETRTYTISFLKEQAADPPWVTVGEPANGTVEIKIGEELFTRYCFEGAPKPYCYPVIGPNGLPVTRAYPMRDDIEGERRDHPHHRSFWFTHGEVNGIDFWAESDNTGHEVHRGFDRLVSGPVYGILQATNDWLALDGQKICEDTRELRFYNIPEVRLFDFTVTLRATEGSVEFGDTKEGTMGFRVATSMDVDSNLGGRITNSQGHCDGEAWGKAAAWCDYSGPVKGTIVGISIFDHPTSFRHPTYWHVRTYGLFAANPFGLRHFIADKTGKGRFTLEQGREITFRYRILIHMGNVEEAQVAEWYEEYANPPHVEVTRADK